jgi:hypothetical protein
VWEAVRAWEGGLGGFDLEGPPGPLHHNAVFSGDEYLYYTVSSLMLHGVSQRCVAGDTRSTPNRGKIVKPYSKEVK